MKRKMKSYRFKEQTIKKLNALKNYYNNWEPDLELTETEIVEWAIDSAYFRAAERGDVPEEERL